MPVLPHDNELLIYICEPHDKGYERKTDSREKGDITRRTQKLRKTDKKRAKEKWKTEERKRKEATSSLSPPTTRLHAGKLINSWTQI